MNRKEKSPNTIESIENTHVHVSSYFHLFRDCFDSMIIIETFSLDLFGPFNLDLISFHFDGALKKVDHNPIWSIKWL